MIREVLHQEHSSPFPQSCEVLFVGKTRNEVQHGLGLRLRFSPNGTAVDSHGREPVVRDTTTAEVPNGTTGITIGMSHVVLSGLNISSEHLTTGSHPQLPPATIFVAETSL